MKLIYYLLFILLITACTDGKTEHREKQPETDQPGNFLTSLDTGIYYINIIDRLECMSCSPVFKNVAFDIMTKKPTEKIYYVFSYLRKIEQNTFFKENFGSLNAQKVFDNNTYKGLINELSIPFRSSLVVYDATNQRILEVIKYKKRNINDFSHI